MALIRCDIFCKVVDNYGDSAHAPWLFAVLAELTAVTIGFVAGVAPALCAARLDPVEALHAE